MQTIALTIPRPFPWQSQVKREAKRFNVVCIGRRAGKTSLGKIILADEACLRYPVGWFSPTYKDMLEVWRDLVQTFAPIITRQNASERRIELITGGVFEFWSLDNPQAGRGRKYKRVIIDEAAFVPHLLDIWNYAIRPTLADMEGDAWVFSTPKGRNGFYAMWMLTLNDSEWKGWQMPSTVNPNLPVKELEALRATMPERVYRQEILAEFIDDAGGVFRRVMEAATAAPLDKAEPGKHYVAGVDVATEVDFTAVIVMDAVTKEMVHIDRFNRVDFPTLENRLAAVYDRFKPSPMIIESNSIGLSVIDHMRQKGITVQEFVTTAVTKTEIIQNLQAAFEHDAIKILPDNVLVNELQAYEGQRMTTYYKYGAPDGMHDDTVMALALCWYGVNGRVSTIPNPFYN